MLEKIKSRVDKEIPLFLNRVNTKYSLKKSSPLLFKSIKEFMLSEGKRIRPILFIIGYLGFKKRAVPGLYTGALSLELLHDFLLIHDDIIDKSDTRRGKPALHKKLNFYLKGSGTKKVRGEDLAIVTGDIVYALGINALLAVKEKAALKEKAMSQFSAAAIYTGSGEFIELLYGLKKLPQITKAHIYKIYDYKTANYTFASPLIMGAMLAGAEEKEISKLHKYGLNLGRAFQIKDDILGMFGSEKLTGKSSLSDLKEAKKTILIWYAYNKANKNGRLIIEKLFSKKVADRKDLLKIRALIKEAGALTYAKREIMKFLTKSEKIILSTKISTPCKITLGYYARTLLKISHIN